ncbi:intraflagellar transport protein 140 homolog [Onthophagus taurus]|uniref:intraflagellar transport protein 140 homolog n=1 Tax=Onthophagus taurus TaxID=166361 RepID=UPI0039BDB6F2
MTLYFESPVSFLENGAISTSGIWHPNAPLLAIASYSQEKGGFVTIFDELGEPLQDIIFPTHPVSQVTALAWHPEKRLLITGWENGEIRTWTNSEKDFVTINAPHKVPVMLIGFSEKGNRLVTCDSSGSLVGWKMEGKSQIVTAFHHELKECITHLAFRSTVKTSDFDIEGLARAAVNGDEQALDIFSNWRPKTTARKFRLQNGNDNLCFYVGTQEGSVYYINQSGACTEVLNTEGVPLSYVLYHPVRDVLIIMLEGLTIGYFNVDLQGQLTEVTKVKLSGKTQGVRTNQGLVWTGNGSLAILTGDLMVRVWDIDTNDNYVLPTTFKTYSFEKDRVKQINESFTCLSFCQSNQTLCGATNIGRIYFWVKRPFKNEFIENPEDCWELTNITSVNGTIKQIMWGSISLRLPLLSVNAVTKVYIMKEQSLCCCCSEKIWAIQKNANQILLETEDTNYLLNLEVQVTDISVNENYLIVTNGRNVLVYEINWKGGEINSGVKYNEKSKISMTLLSNFVKDNEGVLVYDKFVVTLYPNSVNIYSVNANLICSIPTISNEGEPIGFDVHNQFLTVFTIEGYLKVYDLTERTPKLITTPCNLYDLCTDFGEIIQAKSNSAGTKIALTLAASNLIPDGKLYIFDIEKDKLNWYDFKKRNSTDYEDENEVESNQICTNRIPLSVYWDHSDPRLLICNAKKLKTPISKSLINLYGNKNELENEDHVLVSIFYSESGICIHDIKAIPSEAKLLGLNTPYIIILKKMSILREVMNEFVGLEGCNKTTREAVLDFSYNLTLGNMDAAFKAIKLVHSAGVWTSLARMCVKTRRLDVAGVCLGHMGNARAARALRQALSDQNLELEAKLAVLAIQLGMLDEAEQLYIQCERYDLLNKLLQTRNKMEEALSLAEKKDRIHLRNTQYLYGKELELKGNIKEAITHYELANTHRQDVPRMLLDDPERLKSYMMQTNDAEMLKWWGQNIESQGDMGNALKIYVKAGDVYSQVRVLCFMNEEAKAAELARRSNDKAAFYHMARHYETIGNIEEAVSFFIKANAYSNAVRLCKENNLSDELWNIGTVSTNRDKIECAKHLESIGFSEKSAILYHRAGMLHKALDLAFKNKQFETLQQIAVDLDAESDPALIKKCAEYFVSNQQFEKAVDLLAIGKKYKEAIDLCLKYNVQLTEDLVEKLTPEKDQIPEETRLKILETLGESLLEQSNYHLATKKFTQSGNKIKAMKSLLKSGDTDKIIFFAGVSRQREIYIMAANYLQSLDWQNKPEILRHIITFYSKGKSPDLLANFYVACAQVEIDEFQNYEKAFGALTEASRCLTKVTTPQDPNQLRRATEIVQNQLTNVKRFIDIKKLFDRGDLQSAMNQCRQLLVTGGPDLERSVRRGDVYALIIQMCVKNGNFNEAKQYLNELKQIVGNSNVFITYYVNKDVIEDVARGLGVSVATLIPLDNKNQDGDDDDDEEEIVEE